MFRQMVHTPPLIAVLDDEPQFCKALGRLLKTHGLEVVTFALRTRICSRPARHGCPIASCWTCTCRT